jgi:hypothetical protein
LQSAIRAPTEYYFLGMTIRQATGYRISPVACLSLPHVNPAFQRLPLRRNSRIYNISLLFAWQVLVALVLLPLSVSKAHEHPEY